MSNFSIFNIFAFVITKLCMNILQNTGIDFPSYLFRSKSKVKVEGQILRQYFSLLELSIFIIESPTKCQNVCLAKLYWRCVVLFFYTGHSFCMILKNVHLLSKFDLFVFSLARRVRRVLSSLKPSVRPSVSCTTYYLCS